MDGRAMCCDKRVVPAAPAGLHRTPGRVLQGARQVQGAQGCTLLLLAPTTTHAPHALPETPPPPFSIVEPLAFVTPMRAHSHR